MSRDNFWFTRVVGIRIRNEGGVLRWHFTIVDPGQPGIEILNLIIEKEKSPFEGVRTHPHPQKSVWLVRSVPPRKFCEIFKRPQKFLCAPAPGLPRAMTERAYHRPHPLFGFRPPIEIKIKNLYRYACTLAIRR
jgi:hypothetical protein